MDPVDEVMADVTNRVEDVMHALIIDVAKELDKDLGIEVTYQMFNGKILGRKKTRDRAGTAAVIGRSLPGDFPRWETKWLRESVTTVVYRTPDVVHGVISTNTPYDESLNRTRPFRDLTESKWVNRAEARFALSLRS